MRLTCVALVLTLVACASAEEEPDPASRPGAAFMSEALQRRLLAACPSAMGLGASAAGARDGLYRSCRTAVADT